MPTAPKSAFLFEGFEQANTTPIPDVLFDLLLPHLGYAELKVLLYIIRRTKGFKKDTDPISFNQFLRGITTRSGKVLDHGCGIKDRSSLSLALKSLEKKGIIRSSKGIDERGENETTIYSIRWKGERKEEGNTGEGISQKSEQPSVARGEEVVGQPDYPGRAAPPPVVGQPYPQETELQQTDIQYRNSRIKMQGSVSKEQQGYQNFQAIGDLLKQKTEQQGREVLHLPESIEASIDDISTEFNDASKRRSNRTRVLHIYQVSGKTEERFTSYLYEARSITKQQGSVKNKMPYFFRVLADITGVQQRAGNTFSDASTTPQNGPTTNLFTGNG